METTVTQGGVQIKTPEPGWIGEVLGTTILDMEIMPMGPARGFQSTTWKLQLTCDPPGSAPETVILKSETTNQEFNELTRLANSYIREVGVYQHLIPRLKNHQPVVYACDANQPCWLLIEDLTHLRAGDQVVGLTRHETRDTIQRMAVLHAEFWMDPHLEQQDWLPANNFWFAQPDTELVEPFFQGYGVRLGESASKICRAVLEQSEAINSAISERPWTLIHGDLRADNLLFGGTTESPAATILDWSWASRSMAAIDLAFLIGGSTPIPQRRGYLDDLLVAWHDALLSQGVRDYSLADARRDLQLASLRALTTAVVVSSFDKKLDINIRSSLLWDQAIQRHGAFAEELEAWQALPDPSSFS
jgi:thiamine kinase-like enzyme